MAQYYLTKTICGNTTNEELYNEEKNDALREAWEDWDGLREYEKLNTTKFIVYENTVDNIVFDLTNDIFLPGMWKEVTAFMDDDIRETVHYLLAPCTVREFLTEYVKRDSNFEELLYTEYSFDVALLKYWNEKQLKED